MKNDIQIGFIGLGTMGGPIALNLCKAGHRLLVHDVRRAIAQPLIDAGAVWVDSVPMVAESSNVVFTSLPGPPEVEAVALGANGMMLAMRKGSAYFDLSSNSPTTMRKVHAAFAERGVHALDAPISGGPRGAKEGTLAIWVGGDRAVYDLHKPLLDVIGNHVAYVGAIGSGSIAKLVSVCTAYTVNCALAEIFSLGVKAGVEPLTLWDVVRQGAIGRRRTLDVMIDQFLPGKYDPAAFALRLAHKDVTLGTALAREIGVPMRMTNLALAEMTEALGRGWGDRDARSCMLLEQERIGIHIAVDPERLRETLERDPPAKGDPKHG